eukprot:TRINITY_DN29466_c0_g1_i1.p1 TRINITY_DN29466_c0_g1~~TRINITY_DN29466_c0_g1_i1.p1  ORF type:complete len:190 (+),score=24.57 TRINITY_DN29466_c0_g1_i1:87-656(+)
MATMANSICASSSSLLSGQAHFAVAPRHVSVRAIPRVTRVRASVGDGLRTPRPPRAPGAPAVAPPPSPPQESTSTSSPPATPSVTAAAPPPSPPAAAPAAAPRAGSGVVTIEFQRQRAKEMTAYFQDVKFETQVREGRVFGWTRKNEIANGRWTMFGFAVGLLTEFATGVNFPDQLAIIISNLGIADLD